ncbi:MAG: hypothetical protein JXR96_00525 [Deltaproteobacteria bacterium]|nr:hypothetical protein [Deltaproteobacteria bacterium]
MRTRGALASACLWALLAAGCGADTAGTDDGGARDSAADADGAGAPGDDGGSAADDGGEDGADGFEPDAGGGDDSGPDADGDDGGPGPDLDPCTGHCENGQRDCGEEDVDCGGACAPCAERYPAPAYLFAVPKGSGRVLVGWRMVSACADCGYHVYRSDNGGPALRRSDTPVQDQTNFLDEDVVDGGLYAYTVRLVDRSGVEGPSSHAISVTAGPQDDGQVLHWSDVFAPRTWHYDSGDIKVGDVNGNGQPDYLLLVARAAIDPPPDPPDNIVAEPVHVLVYLDDGRLVCGHYDTGLRWAGEFPWTLWDLDGDGREELIGLVADQAQDRLRAVVADGASCRGLHASAPIEHEYPLSEGGNRVYLTVASFGGRPHAIVQSGIYPREENWTIALGSELNRFWAFHRPGGQNHGGSHMIRSADLDGDGDDEVLHGGYCLDSFGRLLWERDFRHPDVTWPADVRPDLAGLEILYAVEQDGGENVSAALVRSNGQILWSEPYGGCGGGLYHGHAGWVAELDGSSAGLECFVKFSMDRACDPHPERDWEYRLYGARGEVLGEDNRNHPIYWEGDGQARTGGVPLTGQKHVYVADVVGDYREEYVVLTKGGGVGEIARFTGDLYVFTNATRNPHGKQPSPWEDHLYALDKRWTGYR